MTFESETDLYSNGSRWFSPVNSRFLTQGMVSPEQPNPYLLNGNDPFKVSEVNWDAIAGPGAFTNYGVFVYGLGDSITFGHFDDLIGTDGAQAEALQNGFYYGGLAVGIAAQLAIGNYAATANLANAGRWTYLGVRAAQAYTLAGDAVGIYDSRQGIAQGDFGPSTSSASPPPSAGPRVRIVVQEDFQLASPNPAGCQ